LVGIFVSWLISLVDTLSKSMTIHGKDTQLQRAEKTIVDLKEEIHKLELETARLKGNSNLIDDRKDEGEEKTLRPSIFQSFRHHLG